jgi:rare lipoprotein A
MVESLRPIVLVALLALAGCAYMPLGESRIQSSEGESGQSQQYAAGKQDRVRVNYKTLPGQIDPKIQPYSVMGKTYWPVQSAVGFRQEGLASWYGIDFHGKKTATGETYDMFSISAAHKTLPLGTKVRVTNLDNGRQLELVINDRGPFVDGRIIDLSYASARLLGMADNGVAHVRVEGVADNPVLANSNSKAVAVASADNPPRKPKQQYMEKNLDDEPARAQAVKSARTKEHPLLASKEQSAKIRQPAVEKSVDMSEGGQFSVQVGAFAQDENARKIKDRLVQAGFRGARVVRAVRGERELSVVQAGHFEAREEAEEVLRAVKEQFPSSFISTGA